jgi:hypothetical protein
MSCFPLVNGFFPNGMGAVPMRRMGETLKVRFNIYTFLPMPHNEDAYVR